MKDEHPFWNFIKAKINWPLLKVQLGIFAVIVFFYEPLLKLYEQYIICPILSKFDNTSFSSAVFIIIIVSYSWFVIREQIKNNYQGTSNTVVVLLILTGVYFFYRCFSNEYRYYGIFNNNYIYYADVLPLYTGYFLWLLRKNWRFYKAPPKDVESTAIGFVTDQPIEDDTQDDLKRQPYAENIAKQIIATRPEPPQKFLKSYAIGINGKWGSGKTSFVNLIEMEIKKQSNCYIWIKFNPWDSIDRENIVEDFFKTLRNYISPYSSFLSDNLKEYSRLLGNISYGGVEFVLNPGYSNKTITDSFEKINNILEVLGKKLIISIDDMDRLQKEEIHQVIRLIRDTAAFDNTIFIATYDKDYVSKAFIDLCEIEPERFLEKIFSIEIELPYIDPFILRSDLYNIFKKRLNGKYEEDIKLIASRYYKEIYELLDIFVETRRDVYRFTNNFFSLFYQIDDEIDFVDYFNLTLIRFKYPQIINLLYEKFDDIFDNRDILELKGSKISLNETKDGLDKGKTKLVLYIEDLGFRSNARSLERAIQILFRSRDFNRAEDDFNKGNLHIFTIRSIKYRNSFYKYFTNIILSSDISQKDYANLFLLNSNEFILRCKEIVDRGARFGLYNKFDEHYATSKGDLNKILLAIPELSQYKSSFEKQIPFPFAYHQFSQILSRNYDFYDKIEYNEFLKKLLSKPEYREYNTIFISTLLTRSSTRTFTNFPLTEDEAFSINHTYLKKYLNDNKNEIDDTAWELVKRCTRHYNTGTPYIRIDDNIRKEIKGLLIEEGILLSAKFVIEKRTDGYGLTERSKELFNNNYDELKEFINRFSEADKNEKTEFLEFVDVIESTQDVYKEKFKYLKID